MSAQTTMTRAGTLDYWECRKCGTRILDPKTNKWFIVGKRNLEYPTEIEIVRTLNKNLTDPTKTTVEYRYLHKSCGAFLIPLKHWTSTNSDRLKQKELLPDAYALMRQKNFVHLEIIRQ